MTTDIHEKAEGFLRTRPFAFKVFISSTFEDLSAERQAAKNAIAELNGPLAPLGLCLVPMDMQFGANARPPLPLCLENVESSDLLVSIVAHRAGWILPDGRSITECEFDHAKEKGVPCVAFLISSDKPTLPKDYDTDPLRIEALSRFKRKIDESLKRDTYRSVDHLRGHVLRDVLHWVLEQQEVTSRLSTPGIVTALTAIEEYRILLGKGDFDEAVKLITSQRFLLDMKRHGTQSLQRELMRSLLELGRLEEPGLVTEYGPRARLLLHYVNQFPESTFANQALDEAKSLEPLSDERYRFMTAEAEFASCDNFAVKFQAVRKMIKAAHGHGDAHLVGQAMHHAAEYYLLKEEFDRAVRWSWLAISWFCRMEAICPNCLAGAFLTVADSELGTGDCSAVNSRLLRAYQIGCRIPSRALKSGALLKLSRHMAAHDYTDEAVALAILTAQLAEESLPASSEYGLEAMLNELVTIQGKDKVVASLESVQGRESEILEFIIREFEVANFTEQLPLDFSGEGDHW